MRFLLATIAALLAEQGMAFRLVPGAVSITTARRSMTMVEAAPVADAAEAESPAAPETEAPAGPGGMSAAAAAENPEIAAKAAAYESELVALRERLAGFAQPSGTMYGKTAEGRHADQSESAAPRG